MISTWEYQYWPRLRLGQYWNSQVDPPRSILVLSGRYHIMSNASIVNNCIMSNGLPDVTLQSTLDRVNIACLTGSDIRTSSYFASITSMVFMVLNGKKYITYIYYILKQLLRYVTVDMECYWTVNLIILTDAERYGIELGTSAFLHIPKLPLYQI